LGNAIGQMLPSAVGVAISPLPIVAVVLMLVTARAKVNGPAFVVGWWLGIAVVGGLVLVFASSAGASSEGEPKTWVGILKGILGAGLILLAFREWRSRSANGEPEMPKWMEALDSFTPFKAASIAALLSGLNPKNLLLVVAGATAIAQTGISSAQQVLALVVYILIASTGVMAPVALFFILGDRSREMLDDLKTWLQRNNAAIMAVLLLILGVKLLGDAISQLS
jgi:hypothetical protein